MTTNARPTPVSRRGQLNFLLTNRIPRRWATMLVGRLSRIENQWFARLCIGVWRLFDPDLDLTEAKRTRFRSMQECFTRELKEGARPVDPDPAVAVSPCDGIVVAHGTIRGTELLQAKGFPYTLDDLLGDPTLVDRYRNGNYVTLRLRSSFYHRFHAPCDATMNEVIYISGDTWNVNPPTLERIERLYCRNERVVMDLALAAEGEHISLVAVAAILVASVRLHCLSHDLDLRYRGPNRLPCDASFRKGDEMGYFQQGSTIIVFAGRGFVPVAGIGHDVRVRMGQALLRRR
jgi:phosphatidylserine decarboxylase